jgi:hypothetical protein
LLFVEVRAYFFVQQLESVQVSAFLWAQPLMARVRTAATNVMRYFMMMFLFRVVVRSGTADFRHPVC